MLRRLARRRIAPIPEPTVRVIPEADSSGPGPDSDECPDGCTPEAPCVICLALGVRRSRPPVEIPDEIVAKAVIARGHAPDQGGIGAAMRAALEAVAVDLARIACPTCCNGRRRRQGT